jgi:cell division transport system permease protein
MEKLRNALRTTFKQIKRSGWLAWASVAVMCLATLVSTIFGFLAYTSNLFLQSVEQQPQIYIFFEVGTSEQNILNYKARWETIKGVSYIEYTSEDQAKQEFYNAQREINELAAEAVEQRKLPASLAIRLTSLDFAEDTSNLIAEAKNEDQDIKTILYSREIVDNIREVFGWLRIGGGVIMSLLLIVIVLFTLLTVEFRMHSRAKEIEIMQLVGGSLAYIRMPFILEGAIYGAIGALLSNSIIGGLMLLINHQINSGELNYLRELLGALSWPELNLQLLLGVCFAIILAATMLGAFNSFIAIRRYIK